MIKLVAFIAGIITVFSGYFVYNHNEPDQVLGGGTGTINQLEQWRATTSPFSAITTNVAGKDIYVPRSSATTSSLTTTTLCLTGDTCRTTWPVGGGGGGGGFPIYFQNGGATINDATTTVVLTPNSFSVVDSPHNTLTVRVSTSTLGLLASSISDFVTTVRSSITEGITGMTFTTGNLTVDSGYVLPTTTRETNQDTAYSWGNHASQGYITDGNTNWDNIYGLITATNATASITHATATNLSVVSSFNLFGGGAKTTANDLCIQLTGSSALCDGTDATGGAGGSSISTSSIPVAGKLAYWTSDTTLSDVATGTLSESVLGLELDSSVRGLVGGSASLSLTSGYTIPSTTRAVAWDTASGTVTSVAMTVPTGFSIGGTPITSAGTLALTYGAGYEGFLTASGTNWNTFYNTPSNRITDGTGLTWSTNTLNCDTASGSVQGCLLSADWTIFNNKVSSTSIDTLAELETLMSGINIIASTEIDTSSELAGILTDETGTGNAVFSAGPTFTATPTFQNLYVSTTGTTTLGYASTTVLTVAGQSWLANASSTSFGSTGTAWLNLASSTGLTATRLYSTNSAITYASTTSFGSTGNAWLNYASSTGMSGTNLNFTNATVTNVYASGVASSTSLFAKAINFGTSILVLLDRTMTALGIWDFGGADSVELPNGTGPTVDATGETALDTTSDQFVYYGASAKKVLGNGKFYASFTYSTTTAWTGTTTIPLGTAFVGETWNAIQCYTDTGTLITQVTDGTNAMNANQSSTTVGTTNLTTNNTFTAGEKRYVAVGTPASSPTVISCTISKSLTAD